MWTTSDSPRHTQSVKLGTVMLLATLLSACATDDGLIARRLETIPTQQHAYVIGTFAVSCRVVGQYCVPRFNRISVVYRPKDNKKNPSEIGYQVGGLGTTDSVPDFTRLDQRETGYYFCVPLPPGEYEFYALSFYDFAGGGSGYRMSEEEEFRLPFMLSPGDLAHLGRLKVATTDGRTPIGISVPAPGPLLLSKESDEAQNRARAKCPAAAQSRAIRDATLLPSAVKNHPLIRSAS